MSSTEVRMLSWVGKRSRASRSSSCPPSRPSQALGDVELVLLEDAPGLGQDRTLIPRAVRSAYVDALQPQADLFAQDEKLHTFYNHCLHAHKKRFSLQVFRVYGKINLNSICLSRLGQTTT